MSSVRSHYDDLLAPIYVWMVGGLDSALSEGASDVADFLGAPGVAVDLGAGFGMHSIPLARAGFDVLAIDTSECLLVQLRAMGAGLPIKAVQADLKNFRFHLAAPADLILCMGDTLAHLPDLQELRALLRDVAASLTADGCFIATFRDYRRLPLGNQRFVPVRSDRDRIHTCFLETVGEQVLVHDMVHEYGTAGWTQKVSSYLKLRLSAELVIQAAQAAGLHCTCKPGSRGLLALVASVHPREHEQQGKVAVAHTAPIAKGSSMRRRTS